MKIILADDSNIQLGIARNVVKAFPALQIVGAYTNGKDAMDAIRREKPELALLDYAMPLMTGAEIIEAVQAEKLPTQCIFATSMGQKGGAYAHGVPVIIKPYSSVLFQIALYKAGFQV